MTILQSILAEIEPMIVEAAALSAVAFVGWLCAMLRTYLKVQIEEKHEAALKKAAATGAKSAARLGLQGLEAKVHIEGHILESVPDAVSFLKPKPKTFINIVEGALDDRVNATPFMMIENHPGDPPLAPGNPARKPLESRSRLMSSRVASTRSNTEAAGEQP